MTEVDNLVVQMLREQRQLTMRVIDDLKDVKARMQSIEEQIATLGQAMSHLRIDITHVMHRLDKVDERIERIETRLGLVEA